jgi:Skp family chaperone for outer membrane proteins
MGAGRKPWRGWAFVRVLALAVVVAAPALGQDAPPATILTLDQERFFIESALGRASLERERAATLALEDENKRIEAELVAEEKALTELRRTLPPDEFAARAEAFDQKVERIRDEQDAKAGTLTAGREADRQAFLRVAVPVLGELLNEKGAVAIVDKQAIILSLSVIDVTDEAIARVDAAPGDAEAVPDTP